MSGEWLKCGCRACGDPARCALGGLCLCKCDDSPARAVVNTAARPLWQVALESRGQRPAP